MTGALEETLTGELFNHAHVVHKIQPVQVSNGRDEIRELVQVQVVLGVHLLPEDL